MEHKMANNIWNYRPAVFALLIAIGLSCVEQRDLPPPPADAYGSETKDRHVGPAVDGVMKLAVEGYKMVYVIPRHPFPPLNNLNETFGSFLGVAPADFFRSHGIQDNAQLDDFL